MLSRTIKKQLRFFGAFNRVCRAELLDNYSQIFVTLHTAQARVRTRLSCILVPFCTFVETAIHTTI